MWTFLQRFRSSSGKTAVRRLGQAGFTVIELLMVIAIITILTGAFLLQQRQFDSTTLLRSLAYRTALSVREAQTYGVSVRFAGTGANYRPAAAYGVHFTSATPTSYFLFADTNNNRQYDTGEAVDTFTLRNGFSISDFSATAGTTASSTLNGGSLTSLTIMFVRPNTDACFRTSASQVGVDPCSSASNPTYTRAYVQLRSPAGSTRGLTIYNSGQISVSAPGN